MANCPIKERTGDGTLVGRCWFHCPDGICPRHGNVQMYIDRLPRLTDENEMRTDRGQSLLGSSNETSASIPRH